MKRILKISVLVLYLVSIGFVGCKKEIGGQKDLKQVLLSKEEIYKRIEENPDVVVTENYIVEGTEIVGDLYELKNQKIIFAKKGIFNLQHIKRKEVFGMPHAYVDPLDPLGDLEIRCEGDGAECMNFLGMVIIF